jgi:hypothetical protein
VKWDVESFTRFVGSVLDSPGERIHLGDQMAGEYIWSALRRKVSHTSGFVAYEALKVKRAMNRGSKDAIYGKSVLGTKPETYLTSHVPAACPRNELQRSCWMPTSAACYNNRIPEFSLWPTGSSVGEGLT